MRILSTRLRIKLRDLLFRKLKEKGAISYSNKSNTYRITNPNKFKKVLCDDPILEKLYNKYIEQFRTEREAKYCLARQDDVSNHLCPVCFNPCIFYVNNSHITYKNTCGNKDCIEKLANSKEAKQKGIETCRKKYNCDHPLQNKDIMNNMIQTNMDRRGVPYTVVDPIIREKIKCINLEKLGYENPFSSPDIQEKIKQINLQNLGCENSMQNKNIKNKAIQTYQKNHQLKNKIDDVAILDVINDMKNILIRSKINIGTIYYNDDYFILFVKLFYNKINKLLTINNIKNIFKRSRTTIIEKIKKLNLLDYFDIQNSKLELKIKQLIEMNELHENIDFDHINKTILPKTENSGQPELDFYLKNHNIAFEINDIDSHNIKNKNKIYHITKTLQCKEKGIRLIHLWEWELVNEVLWAKISQWILNLLNISKIKINSEDCCIKKIDRNEEQQFLDQYNLYNYIQSQYCYGVYYDNELIQIMSFNRLRNNNFELLRCCTKFRYNIQNNYKELLNYFIQKHSPDLIIAHCNLDKFTGKTFEDLGFKLIQYKEPSITSYNNKMNKTRSIYNCGQNIFVMEFNNK